MRRVATKKKDDPTPPKAEETCHITLRTFTAEPPCKLVDLGARGPVLLIRSRKAPGLLITHEAGPDSITLASLASGHGFSLSRDAARLLSGVLADWARPEEPDFKSHVASEDRWELAK
jgi:hypothetical protein